jgi:hypothetical protein
MPDTKSPLAPQLCDLYHLHRAEPFPAHLRGRRIEGHCLATIDAHASACMAVFFQNKGQLGNGGIWTLQEFHTDLSEVLEALGPAGDPYFIRMHRLTAGILAHASRKAAARKRPRQWWQVRVPRARMRAT